MEKRKLCQEKINKLWQSKNIWILKVGSAVLADPKKGFNHQNHQNLCEFISKLHKKKKGRLILVTSGSILLGKTALPWGLKGRRIEELQVAASLGQSELMHYYKSELDKYNIKSAQFLLTREDAQDPERYFNLRRCLNLSLKLGILPIINENDALSYHEIQFGDNDNLAALMAKMLGAEMVIYLSTVDGLWKNQNGSEEIVKDLCELNKEKLENLKSVPASQGSKGGIFSKVNNMLELSKVGISSVLINGQSKIATDDFSRGLNIGTWSFSKKDFSGKKVFTSMAQNASLKGSVVVDNGAARALKEKGGSLLPAGIVGAEGDFNRGNLVAVKNLGGEVLGKGLSSYSKLEIEKLFGKKSSEIESLLGYSLGDEFIHRDYFLLIGDGDYE